MDGQANKENTPWSGCSGVRTSNHMKGFILLAGQPELGFRSGPRRSGKIRKPRKPDQGSGSTQRDPASGRMLKTPRSRGFAGITRIKPVRGPSCCTSALTFPP
ncbi:hypothetical protein PGT21_007441 [Puccinia graminis f. sp. tritici]|uniref:Uncharacterized protein n=1 Tax=Puccinia graminis f. sp. tritici TaxID=56615 RepID=A0A5B0PKS7_PUCGR|nr:hypothetical protein PGTUg99_020800 [Puccinia graminis f. sp. tritici]KAA1110032.1 hypothetical protein PGT21_007441 [Puccinia graminis f. sp. tritici]